MLSVKTLKLFVNDATGQQISFSLAFTAPRWLQEERSSRPPVCQEDWALVREHADCISSTATGSTRAIKFLLMRSLIR